MLKEETETCLNRSFNVPISFGVVGFIPLSYDPWTFNILYSHTFALF